MIDAAEIRARLSDPRKLCGALGLAKGSRPQARGITVQCPVHKERTPSCSVTTGDDGGVRFRCFGCGATGDALSLVAAVRGLDIKSDFPRVLEEAAALVGAHHVAPEPAPRKSNPPPIDAASYSALATKLVELCPWPDEPDVYAYMKRRVLVAQGSHAGLAALPPRDKQAALLEKLAETFELDTIARSGLAPRDDDGQPNLSQFNHSENRLVIPWRNLDGSIAVLQRRRLDDGKPKYVFPPGMRPLLPFGAERLRAHSADRMIVFVEGALDVLALRLLDSRDRLGILPLGLPGLEGWRPEWARFARGHEVAIGFDADGPGQKKVEAVSDDLYRAGAKSVERMRPKGAKDWAELVENGAPLPAEERAS